MIKCLLVKYFLVETIQNKSNLFVTYLQLICNLLVYLCFLLTDLKILKFVRKDCRVFFIKYRHRLKSTSKKVFFKLNTK